MPYKLGSGVTKGVQNLGKSKNVVVAMDSKPVLHALNYAGRAGARLGKHNLRTNVGCGVNNQLCP
jgi:hypothetical protein